MLNGMCTATARGEVFAARGIQKHMWWHGGQCERVVCYKSTGMEETNTLILELRYLFVHKVLLMGLKLRYLGC